MPIIIDNSRGLLYNTVNRIIIRGADSVERSMWAETDQTEPFNLKWIIPA